MLVGLSIIASVCLAILTLGDVYLAMVHALRRRPELERESRLVEAASVVGLAHSRVCVQLPIYNEPTQVAGAITAACELDWPKTLLEILILDDSDDETTIIASEEVERYRSRGFSIRILRRTQRHGYKAGALQKAGKETSAEFIAIFDADFRPPASFLRAGMGALASDPTLGFVQGRLAFRNRWKNWLTRAQGLEQDVHYAYEQAARSWAGLPMMFNGTCGIWRRTAIDQAGGWSASTLGEDQDLSWRAAAIGWRSRFMTTIHADGELPPSLRVLFRQRFRWSTAAGQVARTFPWGALRHLKWHQAIAFCLLMAFNTGAAILVIASLGLGALACFANSEGCGKAVIGALLSLVMVVGTKTVGAIMAARALQRPVDVRFWKDVCGMWVLHALLVPTAAMAAGRGLIRSGGEFVRTPKGPA